MNSLAEMIQACLEKVAAATGFDVNDILEKTTAEDGAYAEVLCQSILGGFLEYGWNNGARTDTPAIRVALTYCLYMGMAVQNLETEGKNLSVEELFHAIEADGGITEWTEKVLKILHVDADFKQAAKFTALVDSYVNEAAAELPQKVANGEDAVACVAACGVVYLLGKYRLQPQFEQ